MIPVVWIGENTVLFQGLVVTHSPTDIISDPPKNMYHCATPCRSHLLSQ